VKRRATSVREHPPVWIVLGDVEAHMLREDRYQILGDVNRSLAAVLRWSDVESATRDQLDLTLDANLSAHEVNV
jgi:hypothetical protein